MEINRSTEFENPKLVAALKKSKKKDVIRMQTYIAADLRTAYDKHFAGITQYNITKIINHLLRKQKEEGLDKLDIKAF